MFTQDNLKELKIALNELISSRVVYLHSNISNKEKEYTRGKLSYDYELLEMVLDLIDD